MTCGTGPLCRHSRTCQDHHCPGRGTPPAPPVDPAALAKRAVGMLRGLGSALQAARHTIATAASGAALLALLLIMLLAGPALDHATDAATAVATNTAQVQP